MITLVKKCWRCTEKLNSLQVSHLQEVNRALILLQLLQLDASRLQLMDFLQQLLGHLLGSHLSFLLILLQIIHQPGLVPLDAGYQQAADPITALYLPFCDLLSIKMINTVTFTVKTGKRAQWDLYFIRNILCFDPQKLWSAPFFCIWLGSSVSGLS